MFYLMVAHEFVKTVAMVHGYYSECRVFSESLESDQPLKTFATKDEALPSLR